MTTTEVPEVRDGVPEFDWDSLPLASSRAQGWKALRDKGRVLYSQGWYHLTHREDVAFALRHPELFSSGPAYNGLGSPLTLIPIGLDPPEHTRFRQILQPFFSPGTLKAMLPSLQRQAVDIIEAAAAKGRCDAIAELAVPYPSQVFLTLFGLPLRDRDRLIGWKDAVIGLAESTSIEGIDITPALELFTYLTDAVNERRSHPQDDILSALLTCETPLDDAEAIGLSFIFVLAGLDTVTSSIGMALMYLATRPELRRHLIDHPDQTRVFVEELIRLEPGPPMVPRVVTQDVAIGDVTLKQGDPVRLCVAAINRDDAESGLVDELVMDGKVYKHWGFGGGPHRCLGSHLARMELTLIVDEWLRRVPDFELAAGFVPDVTFPAPTLGLARLPLVFPH